MATLAELLQRFGQGTDNGITPELLQAYTGNPNIARQGQRSGVGSRQDVLSGPMTAFASGLMGTAPDEQSGSVLDPNSPSQSPLSANAGFGLGSMLQVAPLAKALSPFAVRSLVQMGENAMVPRELNKQAGAILYHGSPHRFDAFDASKIGTGEGAQAYGHGLYLADDTGVATGYAKRLSKTDPNRPDSNSVIVTASRALARSDGDMLKAKQLLEAEYAKSDAAVQLHIEAAINRLGEAKAPNLYKVDLPDEHIAKMLDWDKPLSGQSPGVQQAITAIGPKNLSGQSMLEMDSRGEELVRALGGGDGASSLLRQQGIPGIRYLDGGSRAAGAGSSNYVVFPGNEKLLKILEINGVPALKAK